MDKLIKYILLGALFCTILLIDFSAICKHPQSGVFNNSFAYRNDREVLVYKTAVVEETTTEIYGEAVQIEWDQLLDLSFESRYNKEYDMDLLYPIFGNKIKKLSGKKVRVTGYMIPLEIKDGVYAISQYTYASCFFCGGAGVESVVSLKFTNKPRRFRTDEYCTIEGTLYLNGTDVNDFIYILNNAIEIKAVKK